MKLTDAEFWQILEENDGFYQRTAKAISIKYSVPYSRQAVRERALRDPDKLNEIIEASLDVSEAAIFDLRYSRDERVRLEACKFILLTRAKDRGYTLKQEISSEIGGRIEHAVSFQQWLETGAERVRQAEQILRDFGDSDGEN